MDDVEDTAPNNGATYEGPDSDQFTVTSPQRLQIVQYYKDHHKILTQEFTCAAPRSKQREAWEDFLIFVRR